jgi:hypothetical protein
VRFERDWPTLTPDEWSIIGKSGQERRSGVGASQQ